MLARSPDTNLVLLVDDLPDNLKMLSDALDQAGYMVSVATDGASALERLDYIVPDAVLLDAVMPGMDGFETCRRIKTHATAAQVPVIFMTGLTEPEHVVQGFQAGGIDYVTKPIDTTVVLARLRTHLRTAQMMSTAIDAMDAAAHATIVLDAAGRPIWATARARAWLDRYFSFPAGAGAGLPGVLQDWIAGRLAAGMTRDMGGGEPFVATRDGKALWVRLEPARRAGEWIALLEERMAADADPAAGLAADYRLTSREVEVLRWLARGKTNRDISDILGMSPRTVNKHLEHIYVKLGVETRAAATALALRHAHRTAG